jgi:hypothetical protein
LISNGTNLSLYDITSLASPTLIDTTSANSDVRSIAPLTNAFFLFTDSGYAVHDASDTANVTLTETNDPYIKGFSYNEIDGDTLYAAGPDLLPATSRIAVFNVTVPDTPLVIDSASVEGQFTSFQRAVRDQFFANDERESFVLTDSTLQLYRHDGGALKYTRFAPWRYNASSYRGFATWDERFYMGLGSDTLEIYRWLK